MDVSQFGKLSSAGSASGIKGSHLPDKTKRNSNQLPGFRQFATLLFCDLCDSTRLAARLEAEDYADILNEFRSKLDVIVSSQSGQIGQVYGDGALVIFIADETRLETVVQRAINTALELHSLMGNLAAVHQEPLRLHSGIHSGLVLLREGDAIRGKVEALGYATTIAARLAAAALQNEILVSDATLGPERQRYRTGPTRAILLDRAGSSIAAIPVTGHAVAASPMEVAASAPYGLSPFVGRVQELNLVEQDLARALAGEAVATLFTAPPGQGKSRFAAEVAQRARALGFAVYAGASEAKGEPLQPFRQIARTMLDSEQEPGAVPAGAVREALAAPEFATLMTPSTGSVPGGRPPDPAILAAALRSRIEVLAAKVPVLLLLDDWHWADSASVQLLKGLVTAAGRVVLILLSRPLEGGDLPLDNVTRIPLPPLAETEGIDLILQRLPAIDLLTAARTHRAAGGNPLFIEEICHLTDSGSTAVPDVAAAGWLASAIESRFRRLPAPLDRIVLIAAVIGLTVPEALLAEIAEVQINKAARMELALRDFLLPADRPGMLRFKHGVARDILYQLMAAPARRELHGQIATLIAASEPAAHETLAFHYIESRQPELAAHHAEKAGDAAAAASAIDRAQLHYRAALKALDALPQTSEIRQRWAAIVRRFMMIAVYDADVSQLDLFLEAGRRARVLADPLAIAQAEYWIGYAYATTGSTQTALRHYANGLEIANALGITGFAGEIRAAMGHAHSVSCNYAEALPLLHEGTALRHKNGRRSLSAAPSLAYKAAVLADRGDFAAAYECLEDALTVFDSSHQVEATIRSWYAQILLWQGRPADALVQAERDREVTEQTGNVYMNALARNFCALARFMLAPCVNQHERIVAATRCLHVRRKQLYISLFHGGAAHAAAMMGDRTATRAAATLALLRARNGDRLGEAMTWRALAHTAESPMRARSYLRRADAAAAARQSPHEAAVNRLTEAEMLMREGAIALARHPLDLAQSEFDRMAMPWFHAKSNVLVARADLHEQLSR